VLYSGRLQPYPKIVDYARKVLKSLITFGPGHSLVWTPRLKTWKVSIKIVRTVTRVGRVHYHMFNLNILSYYFATMHPKVLAVRICGKIRRFNFSNLAFFSHCHSNLNPDLMTPQPSLRAVYISKALIREVLLKGKAQYT
jgi:hypothetical protein